MNTSALKSFAPAVRTQLIEAVTRKLDYVLTADTPDLRQAAAQVAALRKEAAKDRKGLIERVAYTWFNRLAALRFVDARGWHPFKARVLTAATSEETQPELLKLVRSGSLPEELRAHTDFQRLNDLLDSRLPTAIQGADPQGEVYRHLVLAACRCYHALLPNLFEAINDETELLLPDDLLTATSVAEGFRTEITDEDCAEVEVLGWLYQFYISERKDQVMARKSAVPTEDIPAVTQLFTPHWIVRYLVENSLGRLWLLNRPSSRLREHMPYYIEGEPETDFLKITKPEEIRLCDPAVGSGHMLTYAFDLLTLIYEEEGYAPTEIPALILRHNLHGLEICPRAAQLAELALVFKAREKARRFFQTEHLVRPHIIELCDVRFAENELRDYIQALGLGELFNQPMLRLLHQFEEAKNFGSLIQPCLNERSIDDVRCAIEAKDLGGQLFLRETHLKVLRVLEQAEVLTQRYQVVVANPPYMGKKGMNPSLSGFLQTVYHEGKSDLMTAFIKRGLDLVMLRGHLATVTLDSWMFLSSFEDIRGVVYQLSSISSLIHIGWNCFPEGHIYNRGTAFVLDRGNSGKPGGFMNLAHYPATQDKNEAFFFEKDAGRIKQKVSADFKGVPGEPIVYWMSDALISTFRNSPRLSECVSGIQGLITGNNDKFLRRWTEVSATSSVLPPERYDSARLQDRFWVPYTKGGDFRRWYGNNEYLLNWGQEGTDLTRRRSENANLYFKPCVTWNKISSKGFAARLQPEGYLWDVAGSSVFPKSENERLRIVALFCSKVGEYIVSAMSPTINFEMETILGLPLPDEVMSGNESLVSAAQWIVTTAKSDWDAYETSWDFTTLRLLSMDDRGETLEDSYTALRNHWKGMTNEMQRLEEENNRIFIDAYGLQDELPPDVPIEEITLTCNPAYRYGIKGTEKAREKSLSADTMAEFLSYAVGCMMGRYSLDHPGLILANAGDSLREFLEKVGKPLAELTFAPDEDGIIPVLDGEWFEDDIVARTRDFLRATFGEATLQQNLRFIEDSLGKSLEKYFLTDFYKDHLQTYKKRPIYWLFQSPKKGFSALVYLHRYTKDTANTLLNKYLRDYLHKLEARIAHLAHVEATATKATDKTAARNEGVKLKKALKDCQDWERDTLLPLAQQRIDFDLDDGVKVNYLKFPDALAPIAGLAAKEDE